MLLCFLFCEYEWIAGVNWYAPDKINNGNKPYHCVSVFVHWSLCHGIKQWFIPCVEWHGNWIFNRKILHREWFWSAHLTILGDCWWSSKTRILIQIYSAVQILTFVRELIFLFVGLFFAIRKNNPHYSIYTTSVIIY